MTVFMLALLAAIAIIITVIGLFLSSRTQSQVQAQSREQRAAYRVSLPAGRNGYRSAMPMRASRYATYAESAAWSWDYLWQLLGLNRLLRRQRGDPTPWLGIALILLVIFLIGMLLLKTTVLNVTMAAMGLSSSSSTSQQLQAPVPQFHASQALVRISQLDPAQYSSTQEYEVWAYSTCSTAAMTEVINSYGHHYRITDILKVEAQIGEITPQEGLLEDVGIARTVAHFGFKTTWGYNLTLDQIISIANHGRPVIVGWPPATYAGGHLVVVTGGNSNLVYLADSSLYNRHSLTHQQFMQWWRGFYAIVTPK